MKKITFSLAVLFLTWASIVQAATIRISSPKVELELAPGESYSGEVVAENPGEDEVKARIYLEDWVYKAGGTGEKNFTPMGTTPMSASKWITFSPAEGVLTPFGRVTVRYTITVPKDAQGGYYSVLFFETLLGETEDKEGVSVLVAGRVGALFLVGVKGTVQRQGEITAVKVIPPEGNKPLEIETTFLNKGNADITVGGKLLLMDAEGKVVGRGDIGKIYTFPGATESGKTQWVGRLPKGTYQLLLTYDLGHGQSLVKEETLSIP